MQRIDELLNVFQTGIRTLHTALQHNPPPDTSKFVSLVQTGSHKIWGMISRHCLLFQEHLELHRETFGERYFTFLTREFAGIINTSAIYASAIGRQIESKDLEVLKFRL